MTALDLERLDQALELAHHAIGVSDPNPRVGCVIGAADGRLLAQGFTQRAGGPHAEAVALAQAFSAGLDVRGATVWVTLEPCAHHGRTPPCCEALIAAGIARVVVAHTDPFPAVGGTGIAKMRAAGIDVVLADESTAQRFKDLNIGFLSRMERGRPWVRMKVAASLDGRTALNDGRSQWITGIEARTDGHLWRKRAGAILTGVGTVVADDPRLEVRLVPTELQPIRVVVDSTLRSPANARIFEAPGRALVVTAAPSAEREAALRFSGAEVLHLPDDRGGVDLVALMKHLAGAAINEVHVEAGSRLNGALLRAALVDELILYVAPKLIGPGRGIADLAAIDSLNNAAELRFQEARRVGQDMCLRLRRAYP